MVFSSLVATYLLCAQLTRSVAGISWWRDEEPVLKPSVSLSQLLRVGSRLTAPYELALSELQQLESAPLCHQTAAKLLVNNCQVLEGKDEATFLTDSNHRIRDFVDAYAASLAICDLERGKFLIPDECSQFQEKALEQLHMQNQASLHVSPQEIDRCLTGLAASDSAWNTWVSYRHKALRFCEAARASNEESRNIQLFQRITKIMSNMANGADEHIEKRMADLNSRTQLVNDRLDDLTPQIDRLRDGILSIEDLISIHLSQALQKSSDKINHGIDSATTVQRMLEVMLKTVIDSTSEIAYAQEQALINVHRQAEIERAGAKAVMTATEASAISLQNHMDRSLEGVAVLQQRQTSLEEGMLRLENLSQGLSMKYDQHTYLLREATNMTNDILDNLEGTSAAAETMGRNFSKQNAAGSWWPYIWCPATSLVMGSYGLPPSLLRNLGLVALGELAGLAISSVQDSAPYKWPAYTWERLVVMAPGFKFKFIPQTNRADTKNESKTEESRMVNSTMGGPAMEKLTAEE